MTFATSQLIKWQAIDRARYETRLPLQYIPYFLLFPISNLLHILPMPTPKMKKY